LRRAWPSPFAHRGPDDQGAEAGVALGHTRLAIIDLSPAGAQPMVSGCGRFVISYNGEIYYAPELRAELEAAGRKFLGVSALRLCAGAIYRGIKKLMPGTLREPGAGSEGRGGSTGPVAI
jgi:asparagine synthase (glutamine-hydrolysing)